MSPSLEETIILATQLHIGQKDKAGAPYILHSLRVMLDPTLSSEEERIVAVLHDVVEDCDITLEQLHEFGYGNNIIEALSFVTKLHEEKKDYDAFIRRVSRGPLTARKVKLADLKDNENLSRITQPGERDIKRQQKYRHAIKILESTI